MTLNDIKKLNIPTSPGSYQFYNNAGEIIYIGKAANLKSRVLSYWQKSAEHTPVKNKMLAEIVKIKWIAADSEIEALFLESNLIKKHQPYYNVLLRDDKRFAYIKISLEDEIPGVFITRKIDKAGKYFGPFTSALAVRQALRVLRKIFPYCLERRLKDKPCFYYHLGRCLGVCGGIIGRAEYLRRVINPLKLFLAGKKKSIIKKLEIRIKKLEKMDSESEELLRLKYELANMKQVLESARVLSVGEKYANDVVELAKLLGLPKVPERIEGYDIANIFGREAVGSMVVFSGGEPDKNEYRKFKIKLGQGLANDVGMLKEVLERRFLHSIAPLIKGGEGGLREKAENKKDKIPLAPFVKGGVSEWPLPDLIVVDGGKAQLNVASRIIKEMKLAIPVVAISKGSPRTFLQDGIKSRYQENLVLGKEFKKVRGKGLRSALAPDKLFFPGEAKPLELPLASPALHLIKRVRDEAHRFAIGYHRKLRNKAKFKY